MKNWICCKRTSSSDVLYEAGECRKLQLFERSEFCSLATTARYNSQARSGVSANPNSASHCSRKEKICRYLPFVKITTSYYFSVATTITGLLSSVRVAATCFIFSELLLAASSMNMSALMKEYIFSFVTATGQKGIPLSISFVKP